MRPDKASRSGRVDDSRRTHRRTLRAIASNQNGQSGGLQRGATHVSGMHTDAERIAEAAARTRTELAALAERATELTDELERLACDVPEQRRVITPSLLTTAEAAASAGVGRARVYEMITSGELRSITIGKRRRIPVAAIDELIKKLSA